MRDLEVFVQGLLEAEKAGKKFRVLRAPCMGRCDTAPVAEVGHEVVTRGEKLPSFEFALRAMDAEIGEDQ